jgi:hypothetical protein
MSKIEFKIKSWREISINTYYEICDICEDDTLGEAEKNILILSILTGKTEDEIYDLPITEVQELFSKITWLDDFKLNENVKFKKINICGDKYIVDADLTHFTTAQYIDFQTLWSKNDLKKYYGNILACFIIPKGKKYGQDYDVNELANKLRDEVDIMTANEIIFFYLIKLQNLIKSSVIYLDKMKMKLKKRIPQEQYTEVEKLLEQNKKDISSGLNVLI